MQHVHLVHWVSVLAMNYNHFSKILKILMLRPTQEQWPQSQYIVKAPGDSNALQSQEPLLLGSSPCQRTLRGSAWLRFAGRTQQMQKQSLCRTWSHLPCTWTRPEAVDAPGSLYKARSSLGLSLQPSRVSMWALSSANCSIHWEFKIWDFRIRKKID